MKTSACCVYRRNNPLQKETQHTRGHGKQTTKQYYRGQSTSSHNVLGPVNAQLPLRYSRVRLGQSIIAKTWPFTAHEPHAFFRTPRSAPLFTAQPRVQPDTVRMQLGQRGDQATENARYATPRHELEERPGLSKEQNVVRVWGSPWLMERAPRKLGCGGAKRVEERRRDSRCRL